MSSANIGRIIILTEYLLKGFVNGKPPQVLLFITQPWFRPTGDQIQGTVILALTGISE